MNPLDAPVWSAGDPIEPGRAHGFFTDTTLCIGCKACEVACKQWNQLPAEDLRLTGSSYDNTRQLSATTWRHVTFVEQFDRDRFEKLDPVAVDFDAGLVSWAQPGQRWIFLSDVCKHCVEAPCMEACPTGSIVRTEFDTVYVQQEICNGCGYCQPACPFGVIEVDRERDGKAHKCTLCYDRLKDGREPACAKACPTDSIQFGPVDALLEQAQTRAHSLRERGIPAYLYGTDGVLEDECDTSAIAGLNCFFLLLDRPETYNLPPAPKRASDRTGPGLFAMSLAALALTASTFAAFRGARQ